MLKRKVYDKLLEWKKEEKKKALCIIGARQIGKTTVVRQFAQENYEYFVDELAKKTGYSKSRFSFRLQH